MAFLSRFRSGSRDDRNRPESEADAVRHLGPEDQERLAEIARGGTSAAVRRAAVRKLKEPSALGVLAGDSDESVSHEAVRALLALASGESESAQPALAALTDTRHLLTLARSAALPRIRRTALDRLDSPHAFATLAKTSPDPAIRLSALEKIRDPELILAIALKSEHKDSAVAALERIFDLEQVRQVAQSATSRAARRARARLEPSEKGKDAPQALSGAPEAGPVDERLSPSDSPADDEGEMPKVGPEAGPEPPQEPLAPAAAEAPRADEGPPFAPRDGISKEDPKALDRVRVSRAESLSLRLETEARSPELTLRHAERSLREAKPDPSLGDLPPRLMRRLKAARAALFARAQELREAEEWGRWGSGALREELCRKLEALLPREDYPKIAEELKEADVLWARTRHAPRGEADALRQRYQDVRAQVKTRLDTYFAQKAAEEASNRLAKEGICAEAEALAGSNDWVKSGEALKALQERWKTIGPTARHDSWVLWKRFRAACDRFFSRRQEDRGRRREEWARNLEQKEALCVQAAALRDSTDWEPASAEIRKLQAAWKGIGPVRRSQSDQIWQRFREACDAFFERYKRRDELAQAQIRAEREAGVGELESLLEAGSRSPGDLQQKVQSVQARARQIPLPAPEEEALKRRFLAARDRLIEAYPQDFRGSDLDPGPNRARREKLCGRVEALAVEAEALEQPSTPSTSEDLARRLKEALAARTIGGAPDVAAKRRGFREEAEAARTIWNRLGPVPGEGGLALEKRFQEALERLLVARARD
jgi:hypothetical protein